MCKYRLQLPQVSWKTMQSNFIFQISSILFPRCRADRLLSRVVWIHTSPFVNPRRYLIFNLLFVYFQINPDTPALCWLFVAAAQLWWHTDTIVTPIVVSLILSHVTCHDVTNTHLTDTRFVTESVTLLVTVWQSEALVTQRCCILRKTESLANDTNKKWEENHSSVKKWAPCLPENCLVFAARGKITGQ